MMLRFRPPPSFFGFPNQGFTLIELVVTMGIMMLSGTIFLALLTWGFRLSHQSQQATTLQVEASEAIDQMTRDIRGASNVISATNATMVIETYPRFPSASPNRIRYTVVGTRLERGVTPPTGYPAVYNASDEVVRGLTNHMATTTNLFRYFNEAGTELSSPIALGSVSLIEITLTVRDVSVRDPQPLTTTSRAHLRNRKTNL